MTVTTAWVKRFSESVRWVKGRKARLRPARLPAAAGQGIAVESR